MVIFHSYVSLPEGIFVQDLSFRMEVGQNSPKFAKSPVSWVQAILSTDIAETLGACDVWKIWRDISLCYICIHLCIYIYIYIYIYLASLWSLEKIEYGWISMNHEYEWVMYEYRCIWNMEIKRHDITQIQIYFIFPYSLYFWLITFVPGW
jgi:hypothetical protein